MVEKILHWYHEVYGIGYAVLDILMPRERHWMAVMGKITIPRTHLIPNTIHAAMNNKEFNLVWQ